ncbi:hypothetical protein FKM82_020614 [Ascaphus truei]
MEPQESLLLMGPEAGQTPCTVPTPLTVNNLQEPCSPLTVPGSQEPCGPLPVPSSQEPCGPVPGPLPGRCSYFVQKKRRFCKMIVSEGKKFCGEHAGNGEEQSGRTRIPCPLDPKHTVYEDQLEKHVKKCNSREKPQPVYYVRDVNAGTQDLEISEDTATISSLCKEELQALIEKLTRATDGLSRPLPDPKRSHRALQEALGDPANGDSASKHLKQQASILGHLDSLGLLGPARCFVEFGAGRGKLSHWVNVATQEAENVHFLLVERASTRFKVDGKQRSATFQRLHVDIQHLCLERVPVLEQEKLPVVGVGKHVCGAATDLALRCLVQNCTPPAGEPQRKHPRTDPTVHRTLVAGLVIALCCHHRCDWQHYVGRDFFQEMGLGQREFGLLQRMSSWATCGVRTSDRGSHPRDQVGRGNGEEHDAQHRNTDCNSEPVQGLLTVAERENLGRLCKLLIDHGRVDYLRRAGYRATLQYYTESVVSLENVLLTAVPS